MGLFGALFAGVSGLDSQSNKIGVISNNISNVNTVGFKQGQSTFDTLVVPSGTTSFSPGGVIGGNQQLVSEQGTIAATTSPTDIAISGGGMLFVSSSAAGGADSLLYTRSGSFTQDANGNFVNSNDYFLQGLPINPATGESVSDNALDLTTVNVSSSATGKPTPTSTITLGANFDATQTPLLGPGENITQLTGGNNSNATANQIIVGNDVTGSDANGIKRGDSFSITNSASTTPDVFTYGGFSIGRNVGVTASSVLGQTAETANPAGGLGDTGNILDTVTGDAAANISSTGGGSSVISVVIPNADAANYTNGGVISISGAAALGTIPAANVNGQHVITNTPTPNSAGAGFTVITFNAAVDDTTGGGSTQANTFNVSNRTDASFSGNILNAKSTTDDFLNGIDVANTFTAQALNFSIAVNGTTTKFTYSANPDPSTGTFNSMQTLATAINDATGAGLTAQITNDRLYISATNPNLPVTYENGDDTGQPNANPPLAGINWLQELDLPAAPVAGQNAGSPAGSGINYFNSLASLANAVNNADPTNLIATVSNPTGNASLRIDESNALQTVSFSDGDLATNPATLNTGGSLLKEFGLQDITQGVNAKNWSTTGGSLPATYDASDPTRNMSSGAVTPEFTKDITIFDSLGQSHTIAMNVAKIATGEWAVEFTSVPPGDVVSSDHSSPSDGQIAAGTMLFNTDGVLTTASGLSSFTINWNQQTVGASPSTVTLNLGLGATSNSSGVGITQAAGAFNVSTDEQNGAPTGELTGVSIDQNGFVIAAFSNGQTQKMFQIPLANFTNPNGLEAVSGDAYQATLASGPANPELAGTSGVGTFTPSALEQSNVDLSTQLTDLIVAQQAYGANSKLLTVADALLQELDQIIQ